MDLADDAADHAPCAANRTAVDALRELQGDNRRRVTAENAACRVPRHNGFGNAAACRRESVRCEVARELAGIDAPGLCPDDTDNPSAAIREGQRSGNGAPRHFSVTYGGDPAGNCVIQAAAHIAAHEVEPGNRGSARQFRKEPGRIGLIEVIQPMPRALQRAAEAFRHGRHRVKPRCRAGCNRLRHRKIGIENQVLRQNIRKLPEQTVPRRILERVVAELYPLYKLLRRRNLIRVTRGADTAGEGTGVDKRLDRLLIPMILRTHKSVPYGKTRGNGLVPIRNTVTARDIAPVGLRRLIAEEPRVPVAPRGVAADSPGCHG